MFRSLDLITIGKDVEIEANSQRFYRVVVSRNGVLGGSSTRSGGGLCLVFGAPVDVDG